MQVDPIGKIIIVTGGAGQIGISICRLYDKLDNKVIMADLDYKMCEKRIADLSLNNTIPIKLDVTSIDSIKSVFRDIFNRFGGIDILINNAGIAVFTPFQDRTFEEFDNVMKVNVYGTFFCSQEALKYMEKQKSGCIVNIGSIYGVVSADPRIYGDSGKNSSGVYAVSKAGIIQLTKYLATHVECKDIRVNCISPGGIFNNQKESFVKNYEYKTPMGRMGYEDDIAKTIRFICSNEASYITGQNIVVDGGFTIW